MESGGIMPHIHMYYCANPIACRKADKMVGKIRRAWNDDSYYYFNRSYNCHININEKYFWW